jgi:hypothetical protein
MDRRLGGPQSQSGHGGKQKNSQPLLGLKPPIFQPVAQCYTKLSCLLYMIINLLKVINMSSHKDATL